MQNIYLPNKFYLTFRNDDPRNVNKVVNVTENLIFTLLYKYVIFRLFGLALISFFSKLCETFFVNSQLIINKNNEDNNN